MLCRESVSLAVIITTVVKDAISPECADKEKEELYSVLRYTLGGLVKRRTEAAHGVFHTHSSFGLRNTLRRNV